MKKIRYLAQVKSETKEKEGEEGEEEKEEEKIKEEEYYKIPDLTKDTHVQFAKKIILNSPLYDRKDNGYFRQIKTNN